MESDEVLSDIEISDPLNRSQHETPDFTTHEDKRDEYVRLLGEGCTSGWAARGVGVHRITAWKWRRDDAEFDARCREAEKVRADKLIAEAERRALRGSDKLMEFLLCNYYPERFKRPGQKVEVSGPNDGPIEFDDATAGAKLAKLLAAAQARKAAAEDDEPVG